MPCMRSARYFLGAFVLLLSAGCGGGGTSGSSTQPYTPPTPSPTPVPTATPGALSVSPSTIAFTSSGQTAAVTAGESPANGTLTLDASGCAGIAAVSPASGPASGTTFTITAGSSSGSCTLHVSDAAGQSQPVGVTLTITTGVIQ